MVRSKGVASVQLCVFTGARVFTGLYAFRVQLYPPVVIPGAWVFRSLYVFKVQKDHYNDCTNYHACWWSISNRGFRWSRPSLLESSKCKLVSNCGDDWGASFQEFVCVYSSKGSLQWLSKISCLLVKYFKSRFQMVSSIPLKSSKCKLVSSCGDYWGASFQEFVCV